MTYFTENTTQYGIAGMREWRGGRHVGGNISRSEDFAPRNGDRSFASVSSPGFSADGEKQSSVGRA